MRYRQNTKGDILYGPPVSSYNLISYMSVQNCSLIHATVFKV